MDTAKEKISVFEDRIIETKQTKVHRGKKTETMTINSVIWENMKHSNICLCVCVLVTQSCLTLRDPMGCSLPGSSVHGIFQARIVELLDISSSRGSSQPLDQTQVSCIAGGFLTVWVTRNAYISVYNFIPRKTGNNLNTWRLREYKDKPRTGKNYLQNAHLVGLLYKTYKQKQ